MSFTATQLKGLGAVTFAMDSTSVHGSDGWNFNVKSAFDSELATEILAHQSRPDHPPISTSVEIIAKVMGLADADYRIKHNTPGNVVSDFGAFGNTGAFQAYFNPLAIAWYSALANPAPIPTNPWPAATSQNWTHIYAGGFCGSRSILVTYNGKQGYWIWPDGALQPTFNLAGQSYTGPSGCPSGGTDAGGGTDTGTDTSMPPAASSGSNMTMYLVIGGIALVALLAMRN